MASQRCSILRVFIILPIEITSLCQKSVAVTFLNNAIFNFFGGKHCVRFHNMLCCLVLGSKVVNQCLSLSYNSAREFCWVCLKLADPPHDSPKFLEMSSCTLFYSMLNIQGTHFSESLLLLMHDPRLMTIALAMCLIAYFSCIVKMVWCDDLSGTS